jgi:hypothetical protein
MIDWDIVNPVLGVASGIASIDDINYQNKYGDQIKNILKFRVRVERGSLGFSGVKEGEGVPTKLFEKFRKEVSEIAYSYHMGMLLSDSAFYWYEEEDVEHVLSRVGQEEYFKRKHEKSIKLDEINDKDEVMYHMTNQRDEGLYKPTGISLIRKQKLEGK